MRIIGITGGVGSGKSRVLSYLEEKYDCPVSEDISRRIACLPLYPDLTNDEVLKICEIIKGVL